MKSNKKHWSLRDSKSPQVSKTLFNIMVDLNNAVVLRVSTCPLISKSSIHFTSPLTFIHSAPTTICITVNFMFHSFLFSSLVKILISLFAFFYVHFVVSCNGKVYPSAGSLFCWLSHGLVVCPRSLLLLLLFLRHPPFSLSCYINFRNKGSGYRTYRMLRRYPYTVIHLIVPKNAALNSFFFF